MPVGARAVHWSDLVIVEPTPRFPIAVEVELTPKAPAAIRAILRAYRQAQRRVLYPITALVARRLQGGPGPDGAWVDGTAQDIGLLPPGEPAPGAGGLLRVRRFAATDPAVDRQAARYALRR